MTVSLSGGQRGVLEGLVGDLRGWFEGDLGEVLSGRFGVRADGVVEDVGGLSLSAGGLAVRDDLVDVIGFLRLEGESGVGSVEQLVREAAFTHLNRLVAVRVAEAVGLLPEVLGRGLESRGFRDFVELAPMVASTEWGRFGVFLQLCADELAGDVPALFDPRNPLLELELSEPVLARAVEAMAEVPDEIWAAPDTLGWTYQFFNTSEERREMREGGAPGNSRELAVRNQFFTPHYVVEFLVENGLGAHLSAGFPDLAEELPLLVEVPSEQVEVDLGEVSVLDPACGSGHFLLGAYDVLEKAYRHAGVEPADAAPRIVDSLWGIDIDPRATQIAQAAVIFRARRHCRDGELPTPKVICARSLPTGPEVDELVDELPDEVARIVWIISDELEDAPVLGPLLKVEERLSAEVADIFGTGEIEGTLSEAAPVDQADQLQSEVLTALQDIADSTTSTPAERLFAAEATDAVRFVQAMSRRYTAVLMNPPFGEPVSETKEYIKAAYSWIPTKDYNVLSAFVGRGLELAEPEIGTCGAITSRAGMFLRTFEKWRKQVLLGHQLLALADLGYGVMEQALVEAAAYVLNNRIPDGPAVFIRLLKESDRPKALHDVIAAHRANRQDDRVHEISVEDLKAIPGAPMAYWMSPAIRQLFRIWPVLEGTGAEVRQGLATGDDFRFVRAFWEVDPVDILRLHETTTQRERWAPLAKGGEYSPLWGDVHLLVDWRNDGDYLKDFAGSVIRSPDLYFVGGLNWPAHTTSGFGPRVLPRGCVFSHAGPAIVPYGNPYPVLAWLLSRPARAAIDGFLAAGDEVSSGGAKRKYEVGVIQSTPFPADVISRVEDRISGCIRDAVIARRRLDFVDETTRNFISPVHTAPMSSDSPALTVWNWRQNLAIEQLRRLHEMEDLIVEELRLDEAALSHLDEEQGPSPMTYGAGDLNLLERLRGMPIHVMIDEAVDALGGARYLSHKVFMADRRLEVLAHATRTSPERIVALDAEDGFVPSEFLADHSVRLLSYMVGVAFGRWDVRIGRDPAVAEVPDDLLAPPARYSPGMLFGEDGLPPVEPPAGYPVRFPADGVLVDEPGSDRDVSRVVREAATAMFGSEDQLDEALGVLMRKPSLSGYLRSKFFKPHLSMYSMSRRKAPIYWQLQVPSKQWGVWLYAPKMSREMLFAIVRAAEDRLRLAERQVGRLQDEAESGTNGRKASEVAEELEAEQQLLVELRSFRAEAERIANLGWEPDLDDGMVLNAAPLADLFPAWKDAAKYRKQLRDGKYDWATVANYADQI